MEPPEPWKEEAEEPLPPWFEKSAEIVGAVFTLAALALIGLAIVLAILAAIVVGIWGLVKLIA
jgi:hypothetical protein